MDDDGSITPADRRRVLVDAAALSGAVGLVGISFGVLARATDIGVAKACAMSLLIFTGASQFAVLAVVGAGGSALAAAAGSILLGSRNGLYSVGLRPLHAREPWWRRAVATQLTIDETAGLAAAQRDEARARLAFWATGLMLYSCWNLGTLVGALAGAVLPEPDVLGLDAAFPAAFLTLLLPLLRRPAARRSAAVGVLLAVAAVPFLPAGAPILVGAAGVLAGLRGEHAEDGP